MVDNSKTGFKHFGWIGFFCGVLALGIALVHFHTGPLVKEPSLKESAAETVADIKQKAVSMFKGKEENNIEALTVDPEGEKLNLDDVLDLATVILGFLAMVFATIGFIRHENLRAVGMAGAFGVGAILFQFINWAIAFAAVIVIIGFTFFSLSRHQKSNP